jgi:hypothetical protein
MSAAILAMTGLRVDAAIASSFLSALFMACSSSRPLTQSAITITLETSFFERRAEAVDRFHSLGLHTFARAIARRKTRPGELLIVSVGDEGPHIRVIDLGRVRHAFQQTPRAAEIFGGKAN